MGPTVCAVRRGFPKSEYEPKAIAPRVKKTKNPIDQSAERIRNEVDALIRSSRQDMIWHHLLIANGKTAPAKSCRVREFTRFGKFKWSIILAQEE